MIESAILMAVSRKSSDAPFGRVFNERTMEAYSAGSTWTASLLAMSFPFRIFDSYFLDGP
jgi:hypothetical protein